MKADETNWRRRYEKDDKAPGVPGAGVGCFAGQEQNVILQEHLCGRCVRGHIGALTHCVAAGVYQALRLRGVDRFF